MNPTRLRTVLAAGALLAGLAAAPGGGAAAAPLGAGSAPDPVLGAVLAGLAPGDTTTVLVTLRESLRPTPPPGLSRAGRAAAVEAALRAQARASQAPLAARLDALRRSGGVAESVPLWISNAVSVTGTAAVIREIASRSDVASVRTDSVTVTTAGTEPTITATGAPQLWSAGQTGQGAVVATLDTGVDLSRADIAARWRGGAGSWFDPFGQHATPVDLDGHGTAVTSIVVGGDATDAYGMAPGAQWIAARVFDDRGHSSLTAMHQAFQWLLDPDGDPVTPDSPDVVNASWVLGTGPSCDTALQPDVRALRSAGILPVFAAGNFGPGAGSSASPANYPEAISVGAVDATDTIWAYTSAGPSTCGGRARVFPDLVAPGVSVLAADQYGGMQYLTGTSVAAPHVSGALALLRGAHPGSAPEALEAALTQAAVDLGPAGEDDRYGRGRIDVAAADALLAAAPVTADFSVAADPGTVSVARGRSGTLSVSVGVVSGSPGPVTMTVAGLPRGVTVGWSSNPVAAPGSADLTVTVDRKAKRGSYQLDLTATSGSVVHTVPLTLVVR